MKAMKQRINFQYNSPVPTSIFNTNTATNFQCFSFIFDILVRKCHKEDSDISTNGEILKR